MFRPGKRCGGRSHPFPQTTPKHLPDLRELQDGPLMCSWQPTQLPNLPHLATVLGTGLVEGGGGGWAFRLGKGGWMEEPPPEHPPQHLPYLLDLPDGHGSPPILLISHIWQMFWVLGWGGGGGFLQEQPPKVSSHGRGGAAYLSQNFMLPLLAPPPKRLY